jgi:hypothetical protein
MGIKLSVSSLVVLVLCVTALISGTALLIKTNSFGKYIPDYPVPETDVFVTVYPTNSMPGTHFLIKAIYPVVREEEDLMLTIRGAGEFERLYLYDDGNHNDDLQGDGLYAGVYDSSGKTNGVYEVVQDNKKLGEFIVGDQECELLFGNSDDDKINFVILPSGYENFDDFREDSKRLIVNNGGLLDTEPFKSKKESFSFSLANPNQNLNCEVGCKGVGALVCCDNDLVLQEAAKCHYDSVLVLVNDDSMCGSASNYAKICAKNENAQLILLHELGHSFANLADEYVYSDYYGNYNIGQIDNVNCDDSSCDKWSNISSGCYSGCTYNDLYRSREENSIMLDLYPEYNEICKTQINNVINSNLKNEKQTESLLPFKKSYELVFNYDNGSIKVDNSALKPIKSSYSYVESDYSAKLLDRDGQVLYSQLVYVPKIVLPIPGTDSIPISFNKFNFVLNLPYSNNAQRLVLYEDEKEIESVVLDSYNDNCGDNICDLSENNLNCANDCSIDEDNFCQTSSCDSNCPSKDTCKFINKKSIFYMILILSSLIIMILVILISYGFFDRYSMVKS